METVKEGLPKQITVDIQTRLNRFLFGYYSTLYETIGPTPANTIFCRPIRTRFYFLRPDLQGKMQDEMKVRYDGQTQPRAFYEADPFLTRLPQEPFWQPAEVHDIRG